MKLLSKLFAIIGLSCAMYFISTYETVYAEDGCSGNNCERCQCQYNKCMNRGSNPDSCNDQFLYCINGDTACKKPGSGEEGPLPEIGNY